ncbi:metal ABC transporter solute-binding protein, Zn/Mn family [Lentibacillus saliphilus]|uniref:metal ABC transporter solute-binding protein, Zn/Mn family n=1 Tax=Lentibacillus saliphilus TaxID=2737028 RepID=UPI001C308A9D|nr:zinc ABC transporter substrate-binding protein [Lentibacillus saliphilus]
MRHYVTLFMLLFGAIFLSACTSDAGKANEAELTVYTSIYPIQYAVERIGGDTILAKTVYPPGVDAHTYEPSSRDMTDIADSDAFIYLGMGMESFAESAAKALDSEENGPLLLEIGENESLFEAMSHDEDHEEDAHAHGDEDEDDQHGHDHDHGDYDPHIWIDPVRMVDVSSMIKDALIKLNPDQKTLYEDNFQALKNDLIALDETFQEKLHKKDRNEIIVAHAAYGYWESRYHLKQIPISGLSPSQEPSQKQLISVIEQAKEHDINYIIFEQNATNRVSEIIQEDIGAEALVIHNLSVLTEEDIEHDRDYLTIMKDNLNVLHTALSD